MNRSCWWLVDIASRLLEGNERDAVRGDLAESNASGPQALRDVLGVVVRRQAALWKNWRPWLALIGLAGLVGVQLSHIVGALSGQLDMQLRTYWKYGVSYGTGLTAFEETVMFLSQALALVMWSWTAGFVLGSLSRRTVWVTGPLYLLAGVYPVLRGLHFLVRAHPWTFDHHLRELPLILLMLTLLFVLQIILFLLPSIAGVRRGLRKLTLTLPRASVLTVAIVAVTALTIWTGGWPHAAVVRWSGDGWDPTVGLQSRVFVFGLVSWPVGYLLTIALSRRHTKTVHP